MTLGLFWAWWGVSGGWLGGGLFGCGWSVGGNREGGRGVVKVGICWNLDWLEGGSAWMAVTHFDAHAIARWKVENVDCRW